MSPVSDAIVDWRLLPAAAGGGGVSQLPRHYGWVLATGSAAVLVNIGLAANVVRARRRGRVKFPDMHRPDKPEFNRALQLHLDFATGEMPFFYFALLTGGLAAPRTAAAAGIVFLLSRSLGRCYGDNGSVVSGGDWRRWSSPVGWAAFAVLLATSAGFAVSLLRE